MQVLLALYLGFLTGACVLLREAKPRYFFLAFFINFFAILVSVFTFIGTEQNKYLLFILLGAAFIIILPSLFLLNQNQLRPRTKAAVKALNQLSNEIFFCLLQPSYPKHIYLFEKRLHQQKNQCMQSIIALREVMQFNKIPLKENIPSKNLLATLSQLYDLLLACAQLRWQVSDYTTLSLCAIELTALQKVTNQLFKKIIQLIGRSNGEIDLQLFLVKLKQFEENTQHVLNIAAREPFIFFLFIFNLKALGDEIEKCANYVKCL